MSPEFFIAFAIGATIGLGAYCIGLWVARP